MKKKALTSGKGNKSGEGPKMKNRTQKTETLTSKRKKSIWPSKKRKVLNGECFAWQNENNKEKIS